MSLESSAFSIHYYSYYIIHVPSKISSAQKKSTKVHSLIITPSSPPPTHTQKAQKLCPKCKRITCAGDLRRIFLWTHASLRYKIAQVSLSPFVCGFRISISLYMYNYCLYLLAFLQINVTTAKLITLKQEVTIWLVHACMGYRILRIV